MSGLRTVDVAAVMDRDGSRNPDPFGFIFDKLSAEFLVDMACMGDMAILGVTDGSDGALTVGLAGT